MAYIEQHSPLNCTNIKIGDKVLISPDLIRMEGWITGTVIEVEDNSFIGIVISAETEKVCLP